MKFAAIFLACVVAAQAATYSCESYEYWCAHDFHVLPSRSYYCYTVPFNSQWCTSKYYADCLVEFPKAVGKSCEAESTDHLTCVSSYEVKLEAARKTIKTDLEAGLKTLTDKIDSIHAVYMETFKRYLKTIIHDYCQEFEDRVAKYQGELDVARSTAVDNFNAAVAKAIDRVKAFHDQIIQQFHNCLATRALKLKSYNSKMEQRSTDMISKYQTSLDAVVAKRVAFVKKTLEKIYGGNTKNKKLPVIMFKYECDLENEVAALVSDFRVKVNEAVEQLKESYRCNYKCFFTTGCYTFAKRSYTRSCVRFPSTQKYSYKLVGLCAFNADWSGSTYSCLRTCTIAEKTPAFDEQKHIGEIDAKVVTYKADLACKVSQWKAQVAEWKKEALKALTEKITCLVPKSKCGCAPTQADIDAFHQKLQAQAKSWISIREQQLLAQIVTYETSIRCKIDAWALTAKVYIGKVKSQFDCCVANRSTKISSYKSSLETTKNIQRTRLAQRLTCLANQHKAQFDRFFHCSFGEAPTEKLFLDLRTHYKGCVDTKVSAVLQKFDDFWAIWQPKLVEHYECGFKCTTKMRTPCLTMKYNWQFCAPRISQCHFYYC